MCLAFITLLKLLNFILIYMYTCNGCIKHLIINNGFIFTANHTCQSQTFSEYAKNEGQTNRWTEPDLRHLDGVARGQLLIRSVYRVRTK